MTGIVTFSVEVELGWGLHDIPVGDDLLTDDGKCERRALAHLLNELDELSIPFTFDVVGHLCLNNCDGNHDGPHPPEWFTADPGTNTRTNPHYYAPKIIRDIRGRSANHEICTHTFSHSTRVDNPVELSWELQRVGEIDTAQLTSFVAPRHGDVDYETLTTHGVEVIRIPTHHPTSTLTRKLSTGLRVLPWRSPPIRDPAVVDGVVETYSTYEPSLTSPVLPNGARSAPTPFQFIPTGTRQRHQFRYLRRGVERAVEHDSAVHYWTHLYNLANQDQIAPVVAFLNWLDNERQTSNIEIVTMCDLAGII